MKYEILGANLYFMFSAERTEGANSERDSSGTTEARSETSAKVMERPRSSPEGHSPTPRSGGSPKNVASLRFNEKLKIKNIKGDIISYFIFHISHTFRTYLSKRNK
jgi:hypothetical protein